MSDNVLTRANFDGFIVTLLEHIKYYKKNDSTRIMANNCEITSRGREKLRKTTQG